MLVGYPRQRGRQRRRPFARYRSKGGARSELYGLDRKPIPITSGGYVSIHGWRELVPGLWNV